MAWISQAEVAGQPVSYQDYESYNATRLRFQVSATDPQQGLPLDLRGDLPLW